MSPHLLLHLVFEKAEASPRIADSKVINPALQDWIDQLYDPIHWLGLIAPENLLELPDYFRSLLELGRIVRPPRPSSRANAAEFEAQESEALSIYQVHNSTLFCGDQGAARQPYFASMMR
jgi:hypothetical protein